MGQAKSVFYVIVAVLLFARCTSTIDSSTIPVVSSAVISEITATTATGGGTVTSSGGATVTAFGVCWNTSRNPTTSDNKMTSGSGTGSFTVSISGLTVNTTYYVRAYAVNSQGTSYGDEVVFTTTSPSVPIVTTTLATSITAATAIAGGNVTSDGGADVTARGVCWSTTAKPTIEKSDYTTDASGTGIFSTSLTALTLNTTYFLRAYATNAYGTSYGSEVTFTTVSTTSGMLSVNFTTNSYNGKYAPKHVLAAWITDDSGAFVKSLMVYASSRKSYLTNWYKSTSSGDKTDAVTGATLNSHGALNCTWNGKNSAGTTVPDGVYKLCVEFTENNSTGRYTTFSFTKGVSSNSTDSSTQSNVLLSTLKWMPAN